MLALLRLLGGTDDSIKRCCADIGDATAAVSEMPKSSVVGVVVGAKLCGSDGLA